MQGYTLGGRIVHARAWQPYLYAEGATCRAIMPKEVIEHIGYDAEHDLENTGDSVFCSHGSGFVVPWREAASPCTSKVVEARKAGTKSVETEAPVRAAAQLPPVFDDELRAILSAPTAYPTPRYAAAKRRPRRRKQRKGEWKVPEKVFEPEYLLIDGYNILFAWDDLNKVAEKGHRHRSTIF